MAWTNVPHYHTFYLFWGCGITYYNFFMTRHDKNTCYEKKVVVHHKHIYIFVYYIYTWYINVHTHTHNIYIYIYIYAFVHLAIYSSNPRPHGDTLRSLPPNQFKTLMTPKKKIKFNILTHVKLFRKFKLWYNFIFSKFIQMLQMRTWSWNLFNNVLKNKL
jgi:hypothetical protein